MISTISFPADTQQTSGHQPELASVRLCCDWRCPGSKRKKPVKTLAQEAEGTGLEQPPISQGFSQVDEFLARQSARAAALLKIEALTDERFWFLVEHWDSIPSQAIDDLRNAILILNQ